MISKNHSKNLLFNAKKIKLYRSNAATFSWKSVTFPKQELKNNLDYNYFNSKLNLNLDKKLTQNIFLKIPKKGFNNKINLNPNNNKGTEGDTKITENNITNNNNIINPNINTNKNSTLNPSSNNNSNNFYLDEYFFTAIKLILTELNQDIKNKDLDDFLTEIKSFEKLYKLFMEMLKKSEDNLFPYLTLLFDISKANQSTSNNSPNKISLILCDNYLNLKRKYMCLAIQNQIYSKMNLKAKEKNEADKNSDFESSFKNRIFGGGLFESIMSQTDSGNPKEFKGAVIITKNYTDALDYYETFRRFDKEGKIRVKKFGSMHLGIKGSSLKRERHWIAEYLHTEKEDRKNESWSQAKLNAMQRELPKNGEYKILIFPQEYINLFIKNEGNSSYSDSEMEHYERIIGFFNKIDPEILLVDDFDLFSPTNLLHLKKFISNLEIKSFFVKNKLNLLGKNHIFLSSSVKMKNYFLHVEKEKNFDQAEINLTASLKNSSNSNPTNPAIVEKITKIFVNKSIVELLDEIYLNKSISNKAINKQSDANNEGVIGIADLNLKFFISKNFLKEKSLAGKFYIEFEKLRDIRQDEKLNKILRNIKNAYFSNPDEIFDDSKKTGKKNAVVNLSTYPDKHAIVAKEIDFSLIEKNLQAINAEYKRIGKDLSVYENIDMFSKNAKKKGIIYVFDEETLKYIDFKFDSFFLYETPDELASYFKIFSLLKEKGKLYIVAPSNEYRSKIDFFEDLAKLSL